ncbi:MAG: leucyl aminopeptidase, partial [Betaproteobacteria bacterium]|nr:leucyl aminopeptidase [Betaproteobacteria bacterium]
PPKMIIMEYKGAAGAPVMLVGKGVTFDSGGISLKPAAAMDEMKFDMGGAAAVFGAMLACARMRLPLHAAAVVPSCENMPGGRALKPGDVIRAMNGKTIEVLNTDAEGRLILADALSYCARYKPAAVVDAATLTGACVIALGRCMSGLMSADDGLADELAAAGKAAGDECWRLPLGGKYTEQLKSDYADLANIGGREGGAVTAACFLSNFAEGQKWAHLDIAGTAWDAKKRATGRPTALLARFLMGRAGIKL